MVAIGAARGRLALHVHMLPLALLYPVWGLVQQFMVQSLVTANLHRLIRSRAKYELALHVLKDPDLASSMAAESAEALSILKGRTNRLTGTACITQTRF